MNHDERATRNAALEEAAAVCEKMAEAQREDAHRNDIEDTQQLGIARAMHRAQAIALSDAAMLVRSLILEEPEMSEKRAREAASWRKCNGLSDEEEGG